MLPFNSGVENGSTPFGLFATLLPSVAGISILLIGATSGGGFSAGQTQVSLPKPTEEQAVFFETKVRPVLAQNCFSCHGKSMQMAGLRLDTLAGVQKGGDSGSLLTPGDPEKSLLVKVIRHTGPLKMPKAKKLAAEEISAIEAWVTMGAPWPATKAGAADSPDKKAILWSLRPITKPIVPKVANSTWVKNPIDAFTLARMEAKKVKPAELADRRTLIRRVTFDLTGLPPTAAEVDAFLADTTPQAYQKVVDRLLASPRYGEKWARHWLDVARYADTKGYVFEEDRNYPHAYTYREWVIEAFNKDLPYDRFVTEQLAADQLPGILEGDDRKPLAAMGFLTLGRRFLNSTPDIIDDRIDVTMRGFQGFTVACARCHDHKFDPVPTQDYYSLYAVFDSSEERTIPISPRTVREPWERHAGELAAAERSHRELIQSQTRRLRGIKEHSAEIRQVLQTLREEVVAEGANLAKLMPAFEPEARERLNALRTRIEELRKSAPAPPEFAMAVVDKNAPRDGIVFRRGNPGNPGEPAPRRFLAALTPSGKEREHWNKGSGRLELAKAIVSRDNPLTARVLVNRVWMHHFGTGIVRTPSDFGTQGDPPTHPELLDYLATRFMDEGWSIKKLHRWIVTSATYRQSSNAAPGIETADPENVLWSRMPRRRLDLEQMRDAILSVSGRLDVGRVGGKSVDLWASPFTPRRAVYGFVERQNLPGVFRTFDFASPDSTSPRRFLTTVPQQALFLMNSPFSVEHAQTLSQREEVKSAPSAKDKVERLYRLVLSRPPTQAEAAIGVQFLSKPAPETVLPDWSYGYGGVIDGKTSFTPLPAFVDNNYRGGSAFPDPKLGWVTLNAAGGHPGRDGNHAVIRRWRANESGVVSIRGTLHHPESKGDGVRARLVSSRFGVLAEWRAFNGRTSTDRASVTVQKGDTLDFVVDAVAEESFDGFSWAPTIVRTDGKQTWSASANFAGPQSATAISREAMYAHALMMTNEFMFVD